MTKLAFNQTLSGTAAELLKKLKELHNELKNLPQETTDSTSLSSVTKQLIDPSLIRHKDKGVRIYVSCCIADLLRLYAPDAPYNTKHLREIFELFIEQLRNLSFMTSPYYSMYYYLLESLSAVKSIVLLTELKNAEPLINNLFRDIFDAVRPEQSKNIQICMSELLQHVITESEQLPQDAVDLILAQFLPKRQADNLAAYRLACDLGNQCSDQLQRPIFQYFSDVIATSEKQDLSTKEMDDLKTVHQLIVEVMKGAPGLLLSVVPQLEEELKMSDIAIRQLATETLGKMFAEKTSQLHKQYESTWKTWLSRRHDKMPQIRVTWVESLAPILKSHSDLSKDLCDCLMEKVIDTEEKVRAATCRILGELDYETSLHHVTKEVLEQVGHRCRDKKKSVSHEAIKTLSILYNQAYPEIENGTKASLSHFSWMASALFHAIYSNDPEIISSVDYVVYTTIFPPEGTAVTRTQRLVTVFESLDARGRTGFLSVIKRSVELRSPLKVYLELCSQLVTLTKKGENKEETLKKLGSIIKILSARLYDPSKSYVLLHKFAEANDPKMIELAKNCIDSRRSLAGIRTALNEAQQRIKSIESSSSELFSILFQRASFILINKETITELIDNIASNDAAREISGELLRTISVVLPALFKDHLEPMVELLNDPESPGVADSLFTLAEFTKQYPRSLPSNPAAKETLLKFLKTGTPLQARHATIVAAGFPEGEDICTQVLQDALLHLRLDSSQLLRSLTILSQLALYAPRAYETSSDVISSFIVKTLLMTNPPNPDVQYNPDDDWVNKTELDQNSLCKIMGLKVLVNRAIVHANDEAMATEIARPLLKLLWTILSEEGEISRDKDTCNVVKSHLRLAAARSALKLTRCRPVYEKMVMVPDYVRLALTMQDPVYHVRQRFAERITKYLRAQELHIRYLAVLVLAALEPEAELRLTVRSFLLKQSKNQADGDKTLMLNELTVARVIHLIANHPDFAIETPEETEADPSDPASTSRPTAVVQQHTSEQLNQAMTYIDFYLETMATAENVSLIYHIATMLKTVRCANLQESSEDIYLLSDLTQLRIHDRCRAHAWALTSHPGQVKLPRELFVPLAKNDVSAEIAKRSYLPEFWIRGRLQRAAGRAKAAGSGQEKTGTSSKSSTGMGQASKRRGQDSDDDTNQEDAEEDDQADEEKSWGSGSSRRKRAPKSPATPKRAKRAKKSEEPVRRMASRAAKSKTIAYKDASDESDEDDELSDDE
ncbi:hypothetical protein BGW42_005591 [Actinomortierella wolfii]|nr:hypothetical protein BGW42_005591 [Actinomortierella wolfii]